MGRLIIDGNSVFEIDEECIKRRRPVSECDVEKYLQEDYEQISYKKFMEDKKANE